MQISVALKRFKEQVCVSGNCSNEIDPNHIFFRLTLQMTNALPTNKNRILLLKRFFLYHQQRCTKDIFFFLNLGRQSTTLQESCFALAPAVHADHTLVFLFIKKMERTLSLRVRVKLMAKKREKKL